MRKSPGERVIDAHSDATVGGPKHRKGCPSFRVGPLGGLAECGLRTVRLVSACLLLQALHLYLETRHRTLTGRSTVSFPTKHPSMSCRPTFFAKHARDRTLVREQAPCVPAYTEPSRNRCTSVTSSTAFTSCSCRSQCHTRVLSDEIFRLRMVSRNAGSQFRTNCFEHGKSC
jgi:hypothetical protein